MGRRDVTAGPVVQQHSHLTCPLTPCFLSGSVCVFILVYVACSCLSLALWLCVLCLCVSVVSVRLCTSVWLFFGLCVPVCVSPQPPSSWRTHFLEDLHDLLVLSLACLPPPLFSASCRFIPRETPNSFAHCSICGNCSISLLNKLLFTNDLSKLFCSPKQI